jgi:CheY-like chemotaxis protein
MDSRELHEIFRKYKSDKEIFHDMMPLRAREILLVASVFDAFTLEQDGLLSEVLFGDYYQLNLSSPPRITNVSSVEEALEKLHSRHFDLIIVMSRLGQAGHIELSRQLRQAEARIPLYLLLNDNVEVGIMDQRRQEFLRYYDNIFVWNGHSEIFLAMIKHMEDRSNVPNDTTIGLTRVILLVEDSIRYYSRYLPILYNEIVKQTERLAAERNIDGMTRMLRRRARPKVVLATTFEEAMAFCERYHDYLLCLITDRKFPKDGVMDSLAGLKLIEAVRMHNPDLPTLMQSSDPGKEALVAGLASGFLNKNSPTLGAELSRFFYEHLGFGDFVFRDAQGIEIARAANLDDLHEKLRTVPAESLLYHASRNHFSAWLMARGEIQIAQVVLKAQPSDFESVEGLRQFLINMGDYVHRIKSKGKVVPFARSTAAEPHNILRLADGSMGGKGRGLAFAASLLTNLDLEDAFPEATIRIPRSAVIGTDEFTSFIERNGLHHTLHEKDDTEGVKRRFLTGALSPKLMETLAALLEQLDCPLAVRSSGLLEDALTYPFAGLYCTFILPNNHPDLAVRVAQAAEAIKLVYASVYSKEARAYFEAIDYKIEEERMAILIQELAGRQFGDRFYPHVSGVAQSFNYYPITYLQPQDGIANIGIGLGKYVVEGGKAFRFCPAWPQTDMVSPKEQLRSTQERFYALDLGRNTVDLFNGEDATLQSLPIQEAERDGALAHCASTWDWNDDRIRDGLDLPGPRIVNFRNVLKYDQFPLAGILNRCLDLLRGAMETPVELEFAVNLDEDPRTGKPTFFLLQVKHQLATGQECSLEGEDLSAERVFLYSQKGVGNGLVEDLQDIVWVDPERFDKFTTPELAEAVERVNDGFRSRGGRYVLIGPGRWGSSDRFLGIPITWPMISCARVIVEYSMEGLRADASMGSHFFHNVTSLNIGYFTVPWPPEPNRLDWEWLRAQPELVRDGALVHTRLPKPLRVVMDGRQTAAAVFKPE